MKLSSIMRNTLDQITDFNIRDLSFSRLAAGHCFAAYRICNHGLTDWMAGTPLPPAAGGCRRNVHHSPFLCEIQ